MRATQTLQKGSCSIFKENYSDFCKVSVTTDELRDLIAKNNSMPDSSSPPRLPELPVPSYAGINLSNEQLDNQSNAKKKKGKKGKQEPEPVKVEERKAFSISTQLYRFGEHLAMYNRLYQENYPQLMCANTKFYIETENNGVGCMDLLFTAFCDFMKMDKVKNLPTEGGGERIFCWLGKRKATEVLPTLRPEHHFVNRLPLDIYLKDKQSLAFTLLGNTMNKGIKFPEHRCPHSLKRIPCQLLCLHQYARHSMEPCNEPGCFAKLSKEARNEMGIEKLHEGPMCPCFRSKIFVPETKVFSSSLQQNVFIEDVARTAPEAHWIVKPSYMRSGHGVRILSSAEQLRTFLKVKTSNRFMWGQNYVVQRYIKNPMLTSTGQKFDIRMFLLIVVTRFKRVLGFLHPGYVRKVPDPYQALQKDEKFRARRHLAGTRVWRTYGPKNDLNAPPPASTNNAPKGDTAAGSSTSTTTEPNLTTQNNAKKKKKRKASVEINEDEPVNLIGFYANSFGNDECEEYNYAVRHGCLKGNPQNLPLILTATYAPEPSPPLPKPQKKKAATAGGAVGNPVSAENGTPNASGNPGEQAGANATGATATGVTTTTPSAVGNPQSAATTSSDVGANQGQTATINESSMVATQINDPSQAGANQQTGNPNKDRFAHFSSNQEFLRCLRSMVSNICRRVFDQIKEKANCYQLFSLDICIDEEGRPWLLEVNPSIITENVNWNSRTIREVIPGVMIESLALVCETTRKGLSFLALRTPKLFAAKPEDLVFRQNFLWLYSTPDMLCDLFELKRQKYAVERQFKMDLTSRGVSYFPKDYYPERNKHLVKAAADSDAAKKVQDSLQYCTYRFPSPVVPIPVLEEDITYSTRYMRVPLDAIKRQTRVRRQEREVIKQRAKNEEDRYKVYYTKKHKPKAMLKERFILN